jgi:hypothetical protein
LLSLEYLEKRGVLIERIDTDDVDVLINGRVALGSARNAVFHQSGTMSMKSAFKTNELSFVAGSGRGRVGRRDGLASLVQLALSLFEVCVG